MSGTMQDGRRRSGLVYPAAGDVSLAYTPELAPAFGGDLANYNPLNGVAEVSWQDTADVVGLVLRVNTSEGPVQSVSILDSMQQSEDVTLQANKLYLVWGPKYGNYVHAKVRQTYELCLGGDGGAKGTYALTHMSERTLTAGMYNNPVYGIVITSDSAVTGALATKLQIVV